ALDAVIAERCQRPELVAALAGCRPDERLTPARLAAVLLDGQGSRKGCPLGARFVVLVNQATPEHGPYLAVLTDLLGPDSPLVAVAPFEPGQSPEGPRQSAD
ncbi:MAG: hypothetical protein AAFN30_20810, partial [Actinomycetota bacterium]